MAARPRRETFPWTVKNSITEGPDYTKHIDELAVRLEKNKRTEQQTSFQEFNSKNISEMMSDKANKIPQPHLHETVDYKNQQHDSSSTIIQYQQIIKSLGTELAEYKNKMELMASEKNQRNSFDSQGVKMTEYKNRFSFAPQGVRKEADISSLRAEISRLKRNLDSMIL